MMKPSEVAAVVGVIDPDNYTAGTYLSDAVDMADYDQLLAMVSVGTMGSSATVDAKLTQAVTSGGTYKDVTGASITQLTQASPDDSDKQVLINCKSSDLDTDGGYRYVKLSITVATAACDVAGHVLGFAPGFGPASSSDLASVAEITDAGS